MNGPARGGGRKSARYRPHAEINVTPFVDVMLVLLIVFMVAAPLLTIGEEVDLPDTRSAALPGDVQPLTVTVTADGLVYLGGAADSETVAIEELAAKITAIARARPEGEAFRIFVRGDEAADYGAVLRVMSEIRSAGVGEVGLVTEPLRS